MPPSAPSTPRRRLAFAMAQSQGGLITARQAAAIGWRKQHLTYHVAAGNLERVGRGLYRLTDVPPSPFDDLLRVTLVARTRADIPVATVSHASALLVHRLGETMPSHVHVTVPPRSRRTFGRGVRVHRARLAPGEVTVSDGVRVTTPLRTLADLARDESFPAEQVRAAVHDALSGGMVRAKDVRARIEQLSIPARRRKAVLV